MSQIQNTQAMKLLFTLHPPPQQTLQDSQCLQQTLQNYLSDSDIKINYYGVIQKFTPDNLAIFCSDFHKFPTTVEKFLLQNISLYDQLFINYSPFDMIVTTQIQSYLTDAHSPLNKTYELVAQIATKTIKSMKKIKKQKNEKYEQFQSPIKKVFDGDHLKYLQRIFKHFAVKLVRSPINYSFQKYEQEYASICFVKWMNFIRGMGFMAPPHKIPRKTFKKIFLAHKRPNEDCMYLPQFIEAIQPLLSLIFSEDEVRSKGYEMIGIANKANCLEKLRSLGVCVPKAKMPYVNYHYSNLKLKESSIALLYRQGSKSHRPILSVIPLNKKISNLHTVIHYPKAKVNLSHICDTSEEDPYLQRYNRQSFKNCSNVMSRIDERVQRTICKLKN